MSDSAAAHSTRKATRCIRFLVSVLLPLRDRIQSPYGVFYGSPRCGGPCVWCAAWGPYLDTKKPEGLSGSRLGGNRTCGPLGDESQCGGCAWRFLPFHFRVAVLGCACALIQAKPPAHTVALSLTKRAEGGARGETRSFAGPPCGVRVICSFSGPCPVAYLLLDISSLLSRVPPSGVPVRSREPTPRIGGRDDGGGVPALAAVDGHLSNLFLCGGAGRGCQVRPLGGCAWQVMDGSFSLSGPFDYSGY